MCAVIPAAARLQPPLVGAPMWSDGCQLSRGGPGDHGPVHQLLSAVFNGPTKESYSASLDDPFYEPNDRVVVRRNMRVLAHAQVTQRAAHFCGSTFAIGGLHGVATAPEFRRRGFATAVLQAAETIMQNDGAVWGTLATSNPRFFRANGWVICGRHSLARAPTRQVLAQLSARGVPAPTELPHLRPLRQVEVPSVMKVYAATQSGRHGAIERSESYWRWLISRGGIDHIFVALGGSDRRAWDQFDSPVIGYVIVKENRILELNVSAASDEFSREQLAEQLLSRACHEAIERDLHVVQFHAPEHDRLFELFANCNGEIHQREQYLGEVQMMKLFDPAGFVERITPQLQARVAAAGLKSAELGLSIDGEKRLLSISRRSVKFKPAPLGRNYLRFNSAEFVRLLLGHDTLDNSIEQRRVHASTRLARRLGAIIFPSLSLWHSPWDELYL